jgi:hypothetical protein
MASKALRERRVGTSRVYDDVLLATTIACIGTEEEENKPNPRRGSIVGHRTLHEIDTVGIAV